ncbi:MAG: hypothetical protein AB7Q27_28110 [Acidimicrobiia bacterium]
MAEFVLIGLLVLVMAPTSSGAMITAPPALEIASVESPSTLAAAPSPSDERSGASASAGNTLAYPAEGRTTGTIMFVATMGAVAVLAAFALRDMRRRR